MEATPESSADIVQETTPAHTLTPSKPSNALSKLVEGDSDTDNDELPVPAPRSKLVERLQPQIAGDTLESDSDSSSDNGDAYERVRKMLMEDAKKTDTPKVPEEVGYGTESVSSDDEDMPVRTTDARRRRMQQQKDTTPVTSHASSVHSRASSPGLFVTPDASPAAKGTANKSAIEGDREDLAAGHQNNPDLEERVRRIRAERLAKQELERTQKQSKKSARQTREGSDSDSDGENGRRLTQQSRPTRRAGKKAMADIAREQQRISRNMQLTHQAKTKKKYGVNDLFSKFGLAKVDSELVPAPAMPTPDASSALASSDAEGAGQHDTPPTSPLTQEVDNTKEVDTTVVESVEQEGKVRTPSLSTTDTALPKLDKGKGRAPEFQHVPVNPLIEQSRPSRQDHGAGHVKDNPAAMVELSDSDDDLEIEKPHRLSVFDKIPLRKQRESSSMLRLRHLAHLHSPEKKGRKGQNAMTMAELRLSLAQKARQQAQKEREEKIEELRRRGIHIETEEERERHQLEIEDMVAQLEKSREEDRKLAKLEKDEARKAGVKLDELPSSDESEDEDYVASGDEAATNDAELEEAEIELSGSEEEMDEAEDADDEEMGEEDQQGHDDLLDNVAEESGEETAPETAPHEDPEDADEEDEIHALRMRRPRQRARKVIVEEDGESDNEPKHPSTPIWTGALPSQSQNDDDMAAFGGFDSAAKGLGLTQMFAGTMADYATASQNAHPLDTEPEQDSLDYLRILPDTQPSDAPKEASDTLVPNSQTPVSQQKDMPFSLGISQLLQSTPTFTQTQASEAFEPTQDAGFELPRSPAGLVPPTSTVETVALTVAESPVVKKRNRLHRRKPGHQAEFSDLDEDVQDGNSVSEVVEESAAKENAFAVMSKASKKQKQIDNFNKKTSWARDAIEEQAEESEDEYAGIGGASDEESGDDDEVLAELIDTNEVKVDERKIAAYYA
jgi:mediator of replication checkpoint protein 1